MRTLYVVGTPIGNLGDISLRAKEALETASRIVAEDTRRTRALLAHLGISRKAVERYDAHATKRRTESLVAGIEEGQSLALVTDAGMPGVSDPGPELVRAAVRSGVRVVPIPGPSAVTAALSASGLVSGAFRFLGFLPRQGKKRRAALESIARSEEPIVLFEAPSRLAETLRDLAKADPARQAALCRELTKIHEEVLIAPLGELAALDRAWLGEVTLVIEATSRGDEAGTDEPVDIDREIAARLAKGESPRDLSIELARRLGVPRRNAYERVLAVRGKG